MRNSNPIGSISRMALWTTGKVSELLAAHLSRRRSEPHRTRNASQPGHLVHDLIRGLIREELARDSRFLDVPLDPYCEKLFQHAEFALSWSRQVCQGFVAYYCNDHATRVAYITMIIVTPEARGTGIGRALVQFVRERARRS